MEGKRLRIDHFKDMAANKIVSIDCIRNCGEFKSIENTLNEINVIRNIKKKALT